MILKLNQLTIRNFKGIRDFNFDAGPGETTITGKNGTGKTTVADAWYWLLSDSDSLGQTKFNLLQLDSDGQTVAHQDATVEAEIEIDDKKLTLSKIYKQKWTKRRGQSMAELTGHTTEYFWDEIPVSKKQYGDQLAAILPADLIRTLSDPWHFCARLSADARRKILVDLAGTITQAQIIASDPQLADLPQILGGRSIEDAKKLAVQRKKKANEQLESLPARIDELRQMMPETPSVNGTDLRAQVAELTAKIKDKNAEIASIQTGGAIDELRHRKSALQTELQDSERLDRHKHHIKTDEVSAALSAYGRKLNENIEKLNAINKKIASIDVELSENQDNRNELIAEWKRTQAEKPEIKETCFACGQHLPPEKVADQVSQFNQHKAARLKKINASGEQLHALAAKMRAEKIELHDKFMQISKLQQELRDGITAKQKELESIPAETSKTSAIIAAKIAELDDQIKNMMADITPLIATENEALRALEMEKSEIDKILLDFTQIEKISSRIEEREADRMTASTAFMQAESELFLLELYSRTLSSMLESRISSKFELVKWKLFELQVNGGQREICEATVGGVPYSTDLNTGAKIMAGLDVIRTLAHHYDAYLPVFVDNAEMITDWQIKPESQTIKLIAQEGINKLEVK